VDAGKNDDERDGASSPAAMYLAGMLFALAVDAASLTNDVDPIGDDDDSTKPPDASSSSANELTRWSSGDCALHLRTDRTLGIMCAVSASVSALGDDIPARLADTTLRAFIAKHEPRLATGAVLGLEFDADLLSILARTPRDIAVAMVSRLGLSSPWVYAACSDAISPGGPGRRLDVGDVANDAEIDFVLKKPAQPKRRGKMALPGRRSGISFREEDAGRASGSGCGCFNRGRTAPRAVSLVDVEDVGPCAILCELPSGRKSGTNAGHDGGHRSVIDATIALVHAAVSTTPGLSTVELAMGDEGEGGDDGDLGVARVLTFRWEEFFVTTPLTAGDVERAKRGSGGAYLDSTNASVVRASLGEDAMRLGRVMRFVRSIGARLD
tara:strand:- start:1161 stop:2306 length:1146 start_codon:yes stop_codon:yes gene_type:complete